MDTARIEAYKGMRAALAGEIDLPAVRAAYVEIAKLGPVPPMFAGLGRAIVLEDAELQLRAAHQIRRWSGWWGSASDQWASRIFLGEDRGNAFFIG